MQPPMYFFFRLYHIYPSKPVNLFYLTSFKTFLEQRRPLYKDQIEQEQSVTPGIPATPDTPIASGLSGMDTL